MQILRVVRSWLLLGLALLSMAGSSAWAEEPDQARPNNIYFLVIDHSGSMNKRGIVPGKSRWEGMTELSVDFVMKSCGDRSWVYVYYFDYKCYSPKLFQIASDLDRKAAADYIRKISSPGGETRLYDTLDKVLGEADLLSKKYPGVRTSVMLYSDGEDTCSDKKEAAIKARFGKMRETNSDLWIFETLLAGGDPPLKFGDGILTGTPKNVIPDVLATRNVTLSSLKLHPEQSAEISLKYEDGMRPLLDGQAMQVEIVPEPASPARFQAVEKMPMRQGQLRIPVKVLNPEALSETEEYRATVKITWPTFEKYEIRSGDNSVALRFLKEAPPSIDSLRPLPDSVFAARTPVLFHVDALQGASVLWDFGDDQSSSLAETTHSYNVAGEKSIRIRVKTKTGVEVTKDFKILVVDVGVAIDPVNQKFYVDRQATLRCTGRGGILRYEWLVDGKTYEGRPRQDGIAGSELQIAFSATGEAKVNVTGYAAKATAISEDRILNILEAPSLQIESPDNNQELKYGRVRFSVLASGCHGVFRKVSWEVTDKKTGVPLFPVRDVVLAEQDGKARAAFDYDFPEELGPKDVEITVRAVVEDAEVKVTPGRTAVRLVPREHGIRMVQPLPGTKIEFDDKNFKGFEAAVSGDKGCTGVRWNISKKGGGELLAQETAIAADGSARWPCAFAEDGKLPAGDYEAAATLLPWNLKSAPVPFSLVPPRRGVQLVQPLPGAKIVQGQEFGFEAAVSGAKGCTGVRWSISKKGGGELLAQETAIAADGAARWPCAFAEGGKFPAGDYEASATLIPCNLKSVPVPFALVPPVRSLRITAPDKDAVVHLDEPATVVAELTGSGIAAIRWRILDEQGNVFLEKEQTVPAGKTVLSWDGLCITAAQAGGHERRLSASATLLPQGISSAAVPFRAAFRSGKAWIKVVDGKTLQDYGRPVAFRLETQEKSPKVEKVVWKFGDGQEESGTNLGPAHAYKGVGEFPVAAQAQFQGGEVVAAEPVTVTIVATPVKAMPTITVGGKPPVSIVKDDVIELSDQSTGSVVSRTWRLNGKPLPPGTKTVTTEKLGKQTLELVVEGPARADGSAQKDQATVAFEVLRPPQWITFAIGTVAIVLLGLLIILWSMKRLCGNEPLSWTISYRTDENSEFCDLDKQRHYGKWNSSPGEGGKCCIIDFGRLFLAPEAEAEIRGSEWTRIKLFLSNGFKKLELLNHQGFEDLVPQPGGNDSIHCYAIFPKPEYTKLDPKGYSGKPVYLELNMSKSCDPWRWVWQVLVIAVVMISALSLTGLYFFCFNIPMPM